jgi:cytochrome oxidase assembly protein ShyY1
VVADSPSQLAALYATRPATGLLHDGSFVDGTQVGQRVVATGRYDARHELYTPGRDLGGRSGCYVLVPLVVSGTHALIVDRGWVPAAPGGCATAAPPPAGTVTVHGWLAETESADASGAAPTATGNQISAIDTGQLENLWPYRLDNGYVNATAESPAPTTAPTRLAAPRLNTTSVYWDAQNVIYTVQWWLFDAAGLWWYAQVLRREAAGKDQDAEEEQAAAIASVDA